MNKTVFDVLDQGVGYILNVYDKWEVAKVLDNKSEHFPNTLHWQYGHVLTLFESVLAYGDQNEVDVKAYNALFGYGTSPKDWEGKDVPSIDSILNNMKTLGERARKLTDDQLALKLEQPVAGSETVEELLALNALHVPLHAGKIEEMTRVLKQEA